MILKRIEDGRPSQKDLVLCDIGEDFLVPAIYYASMYRSSEGSSGFYHFSTFYHSPTDTTYQEARINPEHEIKNVKRWILMPELTPEMDLSPGNKVHYTPPSKHGPIINGIIKGKNAFDASVVFVVFNCGEEWDKYQDYTGASTNIADLKPGWF